jgi:hypothetical protein
VTKPSRYEGIKLPKRYTKERTRVIQVRESDSTFPYRLKLKGIPQFFEKFIDAPGLKLLLSVTRRGKKISAVHIMKAGIKSP